MPRRSRRNKRRPTRPNYIIIGLIVLALALLGIACFCIFFNKKKTPVASTSSHHGKTFECSYIKKVEKSDIGSESDMNRMIQDLKKFILLIELPRDDSVITAECFAISKVYMPGIANRILEANSTPTADTGVEEVLPPDPLLKEIEKSVRELAHIVKNPGVGDSVPEKVQEKLTSCGLLLNEHLCALYVKALKSPGFNNFPRFISGHQFHQAFFLECFIKRLYQESKNFRVILMHLDLCKPLPMIYLIISILLIFTWTHCLFLIPQCFLCPFECQI